jgi:hypothetical protein
MFINLYFPCNSHQRLRIHPSHCCHSSATFVKSSYRVGASAFSNRKPVTSLTAILLHLTRLCQNLHHLHIAQPCGNTTEVYPALRLVAVPLTTRTITTLDTMPPKAAKEKAVKGDEGECKFRGVILISHH